MIILVGTQRSLKHSGSHIPPDAARLLSPIIREDCRCERETAPGKGLRAPAPGRSPPGTEDPASNKQANKATRTNPNFNNHINNKNTHTTHYNNNQIEDPASLAFEPLDPFGFRRRGAARRHTHMIRAALTALSPCLCSCTLALSRSIMTLRYGVITARDVQYAVIP